MRKIYKTLLAIAALLLQVSVANAAQVTFYLTTHVDGRTINGGAAINSFADLQSGLPAKFKRAYCTYSFYKDAAFTQPVTEADFKNGLVIYVDYVFDPPFEISSEGDEWYYFLTTYESSHGFEWLKGEVNISGQVDTNYEKGTSTPGNNEIQKGYFEWAFFGDPYALQIKNRYNGQYIYPDTSGKRVKRRNNSYNWQMYENSTTFTTPDGETHSTFSLTGDRDYGSGNSFIKQNWTGSSEYNNSPSANFSGATVTNSVYAWFLTLGMHIGGKNMYKYVVYTVSNNNKTLRAQTDYIVYSAKFNTEDKFPASLKVEGATYSFYKDVNFSTEYPEVAKGAGMVVIYVKEELDSQPFVTDHWITLVLPYDVADLKSEFGTTSDGTTPAVRVLEYTEVKSNASGTRYNLVFEQKHSMEANKPYLFKADEILEGKNLSLSKGEAGKESDALAKEIRQKDAANPNSANVYMTGTYDGKTLTVQEDPLYFYFGWVQASNEYNFYRVTKKEVNIPSYRCYFRIEGAPTGAKLMLMDSFGEVITGIDGVEADDLVRTTGRIYNLNGQQVGNDLEVLPRGVYIVNGKKVMK